jgi:hypothetical protein
MLDTIALAFRRCPKLSNLVIECFAKQDGTEMNEKHDRFFCDIKEAVDGCQRPWYRWYLESMSFNPWDILKPVHDANGTLDSLLLLDVRITCPPNWSMPTTTIFQNLKHIRMVDIPLRILPSILACAPALESIGIDGAYHGWVQCSLQSLIGGSMLRNLRACSFNRMMFQEDDLVQFLLQHSDTLQDLRITNQAHISVVNWSSLISRVQGRLPNLRGRESSRGQWTMWGRKAAIPVLRGADMLQDEEDGRETDPMELEDGLWEEYEEFFFPEKFRK